MAVLCSIFLHCLELLQYTLALFRLHTKMPRPVFSLAYFAANLACTSSLIDNPHVNYGMSTEC